MAHQIPSTRCGCEKCDASRLLMRVSDALNQARRELDDMTKQRNDLALALVAAEKKLRGER